MYIRLIQKENKQSTKLDILQQLFNIYLFIYLWCKLKTFKNTISLQFLSMMQA